MFLSTTQSRRRFLRSSIGGATAIGIGAAIPACFAEAADSSDRSAERILVVVQMAGGNDGLNTVVPYADDAYRAARPKVGIAASDVLKCNDEVGFHPSLSGLQELLQAGKLAVVQAVGYDQPNRSHFESMDIWHTCKRKDEPREDGWLGRFLDTQSAAGGDVPALHLGREQQPFAILSKQVHVPTVRELAEFQLRGRDRESLQNLLSMSSSAEQPQSSDLLGFLQSSTSAAIAASERVTKAAQEYQSSVSYPETELGQKLRIIAQLIDAGLTTKIYYVQLDGFDTHSQQTPAHTSLLKDWSDAVSALLRDLQLHDHGDRVCVMTFSEFGRRVSENASEGTDHGAAGPMFLCGGGLNAGFIGQRASLTDLQDGDLKHHIDFRQVYASVLKDWLKAEPNSILGAEYQTLPLFA
jgi:uncharacterized protein (DUF1501 family)